MNADLRALREQEMMERELVQERMAKFWEPSKEDKSDVIHFLSVELMDETDLEALFFEMCSNEIENEAAILAAAKKLVLRAHQAIYQHAQNDRLPVTILTVDPEDARAMARGEM